MSRENIVNRIAEASGTSKVKAADSLNNVLNAIEAELADSGVVQFVGFGSLKVVDKAERKGRNPKTGEEMTIPARKAVVFKAGNNLNKIVA